MWDLYYIESWVLKKWYFRTVVLEKKAGESWVPKKWYFTTVVLEKTLESSLNCKEIQSILKEISPEHSLDWCWSWNSNTLANWCKELTHWKRPWCWERLKVGGEGDNRRWDGWMASLTQWTWVWASSGSWWWTGKPGTLQSMGLQRVRHYSTTEDLKINTQFLNLKFIHLINKY